ncbi:MAG TPA: SLC13 family permease [bacterium]|nr:SLC13 family permease [bacterium]HOM26023.1 SLC13 family permease [bacterium]
MISIISLFFVFLIIAIRQIGNIKIQIWQAMLGGCLIVLIAHQISFVNALKSINWEVMFFLFSMFVIGVALEESGCLSYITYRIFRKAKTVNQLLLLILFGIGFSSALLMNDTLAIIGTPVILHIAKKHNINAKFLLITLAFSITTGSVFSPVGNPQNFLIATEGNLKNPFLTFFHYLFFPTIINLFALFFLLKLFYREHFKNNSLNHYQETIKDNSLAFLSGISIFIFVILIFTKIFLSLTDSKIDLKLVHITVISALPILIFSKKRVLIVKKIDWHTLIFFASMFILMASVWNTGFFQSIIKNLKINITSINMIMIISIILSQLISNVPLVALYLPLLIQSGAGVKEMMVLASGSTISGNLFILGAASNVIIIQNAEKKYGETITFWEFARVGIPVTFINAFIYLLFFKI